MENDTPVDQWMSESQNNNENDNRDENNNVHHFDLESLLEEIGRRWKYVRKMQSIRMLLPDWNLVQNGDKDAYPGIMIDLYHNISVKGKPNAITIDARTNK